MSKNKKNEGEKERGDEFLYERELTPEEVEEFIRRMEKEENEEEDEEDDPYYGEWEEILEQLREEQMKDQEEENDDIGFEPGHEKAADRKFFLITSESVDEGHPDKLADRISDAILDEALKQDENAHVHVETLISPDLVVVSGEISARAYFRQLPVEDIVRQVIRDVGFGEAETGFDLEKCRIITHIVTNTDQKPNPGNDSPDSESDAFKVNDQCLVFGYAVRETPELMPLPIALANQIMMKASQLRRSGEAPWLLPGGKVQVTVRYVLNEKKDYRSGWEDVTSDFCSSNILRPARVEKIVMSLPVKRNASREQMRKIVIGGILRAVIPFQFYPSRSFEKICEINFLDESFWRRPAHRIGHSGRQTLTDSYGGICRPGSGGLSGKDPGHIERSGSYIARYIAKNIVAAGLATECTVQLGYVMGRDEPWLIEVDTHATSSLSATSLQMAIRKIFPLKPSEIIKELKLNRPIYQKTSAFGHFGRELPEFLWEHCDRRDALLVYFQDELADC